MHEMSLMADLMRKLDAIAREQGASRITRVGVTLGALSHMSADHFREHFEEAARGSVGEGAELEVTVSDDPEDPRAQDILLESIDVEVEAE